MANARIVLSVAEGYVHRYYQYVPGAREASAVHGKIRLAGAWRIADMYGSFACHAMRYVQL